MSCSMADTGRQERIYIYFIPSDGESWANFLHEKLSEEEYMLSSCLVDITDLEDDHMIHDVNIILVSPDFLNLTSLQPLMVLHQKRSLSVLLGVDKPEYDQFAQKSNLCNWNVFETEATEKSVRLLLLRIIDLYETLHPDEVHYHSEHIFHPVEEEDDYPPLYLITRESISSFGSGTSSSLTEPDYDVPTPDYDPRQSFFLNESGPEDNYDRPSTKYSEAAKQNNSSDQSYQPGVAENSVYRVVPHFTEERQEVYVFLDRKSNNNVVLVSEDGHVENLTLLNKALYQAELKEPDKHYKIKDGTKVLGESDIRSFKTTHEHSKAEMLKELLLDITDPIPLLCTSLGISERTSKSLDRYLEAKCKLPKIANSLCQIFRDTDPDTFSEDNNDEDCPTLLHFCAEYNLVKFCEALLDISNMSIFSEKLNSKKETPLQVAKRKHHTEITYLIETKGRDSGIQEQCNSEYDNLPPKTTIDDIYENQDKFVNTNSEEAHLEPEDKHKHSLDAKQVQDVFLSGRDIDIQDISKQPSMTPCPAILRSRHDSSKQKKREESLSSESDYIPMEQQGSSKDIKDKSSRDYDYLPMEPNDSSEKKKKETSLSRESDYIPMEQQGSPTNTKYTSSRDSDYLPMEPEVKAPPVPPKTIQHRYGNQLLSDSVFKNQSYSDQEDNNYETPKHLSTPLQHSHSESEASKLFRPNSAYITGTDKGKSSSLPHDHPQNNPKRCMEKRSISYPDEIQLPMHQHKKHNAMEKIKHFFHHPHDEEHEHKIERHKRHTTKNKYIHPILEEHKQTDIHNQEKKSKKYNKEYHLKRRESRIDRLMKDVNIPVLSLPKKKTSAKPHDQSQFMEKY